MELYTPVTFYGEGPAKYFIEDLEFYFEQCRIPERDFMRYAFISLQGDALRWWHLIGRRPFRSDIDVPYSHFRKQILFCFPEFSYYTTESESTNDSIDNDLVDTFACDPIENNVETYEYTSDPVLDNEESQMLDVQGETPVVNFETCEYIFDPVDNNENYVYNEEYHMLDTQCETQVVDIPPQFDWLDQPNEKLLKVSIGTSIEATPTIKPDPLYGSYTSQPNSLPQRSLSQKPRLSTRKNGSLSPRSSFSQHSSMPQRLLCVTVLLGATRTSDAEPPDSRIPCQLLQCSDPQRSSDAWCHRRLQGDVQRSTKCINQDEVKGNMTLFTFPTVDVPSLKTGMADNNDFDDSYDPWPLVPLHPRLPMTPVFRIGDMVSIIGSISDGTKSAWRKTDFSRVLRDAPNFEQCLPRQIRNV